LVERNLAKVEVASSNLVVRSRRKALVLVTGVFFVCLSVAPVSWGLVSGLLTFVMCSDDRVHCRGRPTAGRLVS
jgi:hypothetical protein